MLAMSLLVIGVFLPLVLVALQIKGIIPNLVTGKLYLLEIIFPSIIIFLVVFFLSRSSISNLKLDYSKAVQYGYTFSFDLTAGCNAIAADKSLALSEQRKASYWDAMSFGTMGSSIFLILSGLLLILLGFIFGK